MAVASRQRANWCCESKAQIDNLADEKYEQFVGFEERGILPLAGVRLSL